MVEIDEDPFIAHSTRTSMFFPSTRLFVAGNPKAAGTTLRWWLLEAHGVDVYASTAGSWWGESAPFQTVWDPGANLVYTWRQLTAEQREDALTATDVLTVHPVRHPLSRLFSAWSGKYLIGEPYYTERLSDDFPAMPETFDDEEQIAKLFEGFVAALAATVSAQGFEATDVHFWPQCRLLGRSPAGAVQQLRQETMSDGITSIQHHLQQHGLDVGPAPRINETVVPYRASLVSDRALDLASSIYADDYDRWRYEPERPNSSSQPVDLDWLNDVRGRNRRYGVLHRSLLRLRDENAKQRAEIAHLTEHEQRLLDSTSWKATAPLRWVSDKTKR